MTGFEYTAAVGMLYEGMTEDGLQVIRDVRARYDGRKRSPFNEAECGHHYVRSMASWLGVWLLLGFHYHAGTGLVRLAPRLAADPLRGLWCVPTGWGSYLWSRGDGAGRLEIAVDRGRLDCGAVEVAASGAGAAEVSLGARPLGARVDASGPLARIELTERVSIGAGETLRLQLR
jgi:hypothetical protein